MYESIASFPFSPTEIEKADTSFVSKLFYGSHVANALPTNYSLTLLFTDCQYEGWTRQILNSRA